MTSLYEDTGQRAAALRNVSRLVVKVGTRLLTGMGESSKAERVAQLVADDKIPVEALTKIPERQYPSKEQVETAAEKSPLPTRDVLERLAAVVGEPVTQAELTAKLGER